ncbi:hypothetical protein BDV98DRAFT_525949 [Pterulicium gracile]|uniref:EH domain-containing protein n=1 Tax=Pterulicium gracile TaxID=1884261 RepID=A0A5C3QRW6_9AGAR|nr:hypothetical protein BDV98DRAFT_525949 [Pterula gracilis]
MRPTPVPQGARARYEPVFYSNVEQCRRGAKMIQREGSTLSSTKQGAATPRKARNAGWRGLSVDLITGDPELSFLEDAPKEDVRTLGNEDRLPGWVVKLIWDKSKLGKNVLSDIWSECDPLRKGSLDCASFVRGMWRIDEELRKAAASSSNTRRRAQGNYKYPYAGTRSRSTSTSTVSSFSHASSQNGHGHRSYPVPPLPSAISKPPAPTNANAGYNTGYNGNSSPNSGYNAPSTSVGAWNRGGSGLPPPHAAFSGLKAGLSGGLGVLNQVAGHASSWGR